MSLSELTSQWVQAKLPKRPKDANKGTFGKVLVVAGSKNYPGAAYLCCAAAYRVGAGLVTLVTTTQVKIIVSRKLPEATFLSFAEVWQKINQYDVLLFGPGLNQNKQALKFINKLPKTVIDATALNIINPGKLTGEVVLTPHPGEMARMTNLPVEKIQQNREKVAKEYAKKWGVVVVLKGAKTVIASPAGEMKVTPFTNPVLATAGTGDVLAGVIAGMIAQGLDLFNASCVGVYIHGLAGEMLRKKTGEAGGLASDLLPLLPKAIQHIQTSDRLN